MMFLMMLVVYSLLSQSLFFFIFRVSSYTPYYGVAYDLWSEWSDCSTSCGGGEMQRSRRCLNINKCSPDSLEEIKPCNDQSCPVPYVEEKVQSYNLTPEHGNYDKFPFLYKVTTFTSDKQEEILTMKVVITINPDLLDLDPHTFVLAGGGDDDDTSFGPGETNELFFASADDLGDIRKIKLEIFFEEDAFKCGWEVRKITIFNQATGYTANFIYDGSLKPDHPVLLTELNETKQDDDDDDDNDDAYSYEIEYHPYITTSIPVYKYQITTLTSEDQPLLPEGEVTLTINPEPYEGGISATVKLDNHQPSNFGKGAIDVFFYDSKVDLGKIGSIRLEYLNLKPTYGKASWRMKEILISNTVTGYKAKFYFNGTIGAQNKAVTIRLTPRLTTTKSTTTEKYSKDVYNKEDYKILEEEYKEPQKEYKEPQKEYKEQQKEYEEEQQNKYEKTQKEYKELPEDYKQPQKEYKEPQKEYKEPHNKHEKQQKEYKELPEDYKKPQKDSKEPQKEYKEPQKEYKELPEDYKKPQKEYKEPQKEYKEPQKEYKEPQKEYKEPQKEYKEPQKEYKEPQKEYKELPEDYKKPQKEYKEPQKEYNIVEQKYKGSQKDYKEYKEPQKEYKESQKEYEEEPQKEYKELPEDYKKPQKEYKEPQKEYNIVEQKYKGSQKDYKESQKEYKGSQKDYKESQKEYKEPQKEYNESQQEYKEPQKEYKELPEDYKKPQKEYKEPKKEYEEESQNKYEKPQKEYKELPKENKNQPYNPLEQNYKELEKEYKEPQNKYKKSQKEYEELLQEYMKLLKEYKGHQKDYKKSHDEYSEQHKEYTKLPKEYVKPQKAYKEIKEPKQSNQQHYKKNEDSIYRPNIYVAPPLKEIDYKVTTVTSLKSTSSAGGDSFITFNPRTPNSSLKFQLINGNEANYKPGQTDSFFLKLNIDYLDIDSVEIEFDKKVSYPEWKPSEIIVQKVGNNLSKSFRYTGVVGPSRQNKSVTLYPSLDGQWCNWSQYSKPPTTCLKSDHSQPMIYRSRKCNCPSPINFGLSCEGVDKEYKPAALPICKERKSKL